MDIARHYLANDDGTPLVYFDGEEFYIGEPWDVRGARPGELLMRDEFNLVSITDKDMIRRGVTYLENVLEDAAEYITNEQLPGWVWYHWQTKGEAMKRALLYGGLVRIPSRGRLRTPDLSLDLIQPVLELDRHRFFESPAPRSFSTSGLSIVGGKLVFDGQGTADGRVSSLQLTRANSSADYLTRIWAGFRELNEGVDDFQPIWDLYDGTAGTDASDIADASAYGGHTVEVSFAGTGTEASRVTQTVSQAYGGGNSLHVRGKYLALLRWSGTSSKVFAIRLGVTFSTSGSNIFIQYGERKYVTGQGTTTYNVLPLGIVEFPVIAGKGNWVEADLGTQQLRIYAELVTGTAGDDLRLNTITFIPVGRDAKSEDANVLYGFFKGQIACLPTDRFLGTSLNIATNRIADANGISAANFYAPRRGGALVVALAGATSQPGDGTYDVSLELIDRWRTYRRGGEASW